MTKKIYATKNEADNAYTSYIKEHITNVQKVWALVKPKLIEHNDYNKIHIDMADDLIKEHDKSKFIVNEFSHYREKFFPCKTDNTNGKDTYCIENDAFDAAWNRHQKKNPHHWEYWVMGEGKVLTVSFYYLLEMLCDWTAMSVKFNNVPSSWFKDNKAKMKLSDISVEKIEELLPFYDEVYEKMCK